MKSNAAADPLEQLVGQRLARSDPAGLRCPREALVFLAVLGHKDPPASLVRKFVDQTGGNPFFIEELFRHLNEEGRLFDAHGNWRHDLDVDEIDVPAGVRSVIGRRVLPSGQPDARCADGCVGHRPVLRARSPRSGCRRRRRI